MERGLLSDEKLGENYGDVVWMYLFQDFSKSDADRAAERVAIRFGISSWPQHFLVDPFSLAVIGDTGRSLDSFRAAVNKARVKKGEASPSVADFKAFDALAAKLEKSDDAAEAQKHLLHPDVVVRLRAVEIVAKKKPELLVKDAERLLSSDNDQIRYLVCDALAKAGKAEAKDSLAAILANPGASKNPNVLRMHAVKALATCGDKSSIAAIAPFAQSGEYFNGLTTEAVKAVQALGAKDAAAKSIAVKTLAGAYPKPPESDKGASELQACKTLAKTIHAALEKLSQKKVDFPTDYTTTAREKLAKSW